MTPPQHERRKQTRFTCEPPVLASFECKEGIIQAIIEDISMAGAMLRINDADNQIPFLVQGEFDYTFQTKKGPLQFRGRTLWVQRDEKDFRFGIEFLSLPDSEKNPVWSAIETLF